MAEQAAALLRADPCPVATTTVVVDAEQMELQVHESVGHPTELDQVYGTEAAYAGTSTASPTTSARSGSELMNITADPTTPLGLGTYAWDGKGRAGQATCCRQGGNPRELPDLTRDRGAARRGPRRLDARRRLGRMPLVRMTNLHLEPGEGSFDDLLADVDRGIYLETNLKLVDRRQAPELPVRHADRPGRSGAGSSAACSATRPTPADAGLLGLARRGGRPEEWRMHGLTNCGKGQPGQSAHVSHGTSPARFRNVRVGVRS